MKDRRIELINLTLIGTIALILLFFTYKNLAYLFGWLLGGLLGLANYELIIYFMRRPIDKNFGKVIAKSRRIRFLIIASFLTLSVLFPNILNVFTLFLGFFLNKLTILFVELVLNNKRGVKINE